MFRANKNVNDFDAMDNQESESEPFLGLNSPMGRNPPDEPGESGQGRARTRQQKNSLYNKDQHNKKTFKKK